MSSSPPLIYPNWQAPKGVFAFATSRLGGVSEPPFDTFNLGDHVGDNPQHVAENRQRLPDWQNIYWLEQVHGTDCVEAGMDSCSEPHKADASYSREKGVTCAVMTADCLPVLICNNEATVVAAVHAGWRGLADGIIESSVATLGCPSEDLMVWIGPAISQSCFEVQDDVVNAFKGYERAIKESGNPGRWLIDMPAIAVKKCQALGIKKIFLSGYCTYSRQDLFFSHRRTSHYGRSQTGRIVSGICLV